MNKCASLCSPHVSVPLLFLTLLIGSLGPYQTFFKGALLRVIDLPRAQATPTPTLDADQSWGHGAQMSLVNPARVIDPLAGFNLSYDLGAPLNMALVRDTLTLSESLDSSRLSHRLHAGISVSDRFALTLGYLERGLKSDLVSGWSVATAFKLNRLSWGLSVFAPERGDQYWVAGFSTPLSSWLTTSVTLRDLNAFDITRGDLTFGAGVRPYSRLKLGLSATPARGGGALSANAQWRVWSGLSLELGWDGYEGAGYLEGASSSPLITAPDPLSDYTPQSATRGQTWRVALAWRGPAGVRLEHTSSARAQTQLGFRIRSRVPTAYHITPTPRVIIVNAQRTRELSGGAELLSDTRSRAPFFELLRELDHIAGIPNDEVSAVLLTLGGPLGWAQAEELTNAVLELRKRGHLVYSYLPYASLKHYLVAAACDAIWAAPSATIELSGLSVERFYVRGLLTKLEITPEVITAGEYKSAPEMFTRSRPSPEAEEVEERLLNARFAHLTSEVARRAQQQVWAREPSPALTRGKRLIALRKLKDGDAVTPSETTRALEWINQGPYSAKTALKVGLVDQLVFPSQLEEKIAQSFLGARISGSALPLRESSWVPSPQIAVIHAIGDIGGSSLLSGNGPKITASTFIPLIKRAALDPLIKGVVLRIDSPGGAVTDADHMWAELKRLAARKPLAVSMGNVAASGGYYIAAPAHKIFASRSTITGSIGVFMGKVDLSGALERLGISVHRARRGDGGEAQSLFTPWSTQTRARLKREIESVYDMFLERITTVRDRLSLEELKPLAGGRVWTGEEARARGLVDVEGGLLDALKWVTVRAGLGRKEHQVISLTPRRRAALKRLIGLLSLSSTSAEMSGVPMNLVALITQLGLESALFNQLPASTLAALELLFTHPNMALAIDPRR